MWRGFRTMWLATKPVRWVFLALLLLPNSLWAATSGLALIPTADTLGKNRWTFDFQFDGHPSSFRDDTWILNTEACLGDRLELGADFDLIKGVAARNRILFNFKFVFLKKDRISAAAGVWGITSAGKGYPFVVARYAVERLHLHGGILQSAAEPGRREGWCAGFDYPLTEHLSAMADVTSGSENFRSVAVSWCPSDRWGGLLGIQFPNAGGETVATFHLWVCGPLPKGRRG